MLDWVQTLLGFSEIIRRTGAQAFDVSVLIDPLLASGLDLPLPLRKHLLRVHHFITEVPLSL